MKRPSVLICLFAAIFGGCSPTPPVDDTILEKIESPSRMSVAMVVKREAILAEESLLVFVGPEPLNVQKEQPVVAITAGSPPKIWFENDHRLIIQLFGGSTHNRRESVGRTEIIYK
jgi:hypothetical protein